MKSIINFESIEISDLELDKAGINIMNKMIVALEKLAIYETANSERDITQAVELSKLVAKCQELKQRYEENIKAEQKRQDQQVDILESALRDKK